MEYIVNHIPHNSRKRTGIKMSPKFITIHSTANPRSNALGERAWLTNPTNKTSTGWHIAVDHIRAVEAIPLDEVAWHAGDGRGPGNMSSIGIEICESGDRERTLRHASELTAKLLKDFNLDISAVKQHFDWSKKNCPRILRDTGRWPEFINMIKRGPEKVDKCRVMLDNKFIGEGIIYENRSYLPVKALENVRYVVDGWDGDTKTVYLVYMRGV